MSDTPTACARDCGACETCARTDTWLDLLTEIRDRLPEPAHKRVHNHGTEEGAGLNCREARVDGVLRGECIDDPAPADDLPGEPVEPDAEAREDEPMGVYRRRDVEALQERAEKAEAERDAWRAKHTALRADVEKQRHEHARGLAPDFKGILTRDDERAKREQR